MFVFAREMANCIFFACYHALYHEICFNKHAIHAKMISFYMKKKKTSKKRY